MQNTTNQTLEMALEYQRQGFSVIPLKPKTKIPLIKWEEYQKRLATEEEIKKWFTENPNANIGIITGKISNLAVIDVEKGGSISGYIPTVMSGSGGAGHHLFYRYPQNVELHCKTRFRELTDLKAEGGYIVAPNSIHESGGQYKWIISADQAEIVDFPEDLLGEILGEKSKMGIGEIKEGVSKGKRNESATRYAGHLLAKTEEDKWETESWPKLLEWNKKNIPPLGEQELRGVFESVSELERKKRTKDTNKRQIDLLKELVCSNDDIVIFVDQFDEAYVEVKNKGHKEIIKCESGRFKSWLVKKYWDKTGEIPNSENVNKVISLLQAEAIFGDNRYELSLRVAFKEGSIWYDLTDPNYRAVEITENGWKVISDVPILFKRSPVQKEQVIPKSGGTIKTFSNFINIADESQRILHEVSTVANFIPHIARPLQMYIGSQGSAKSTASKSTKSVTDPAKIELITLNGEIRELAQQLDQHYLLAYDNITTLNSRTSDALCRAVTGGGFSKRKLYTDSDNIIFTFKRAVVLNGINTVGSKPDLLDRSLMFRLERIKEEDRRAEEDFWEEFESKKPEILGAIFDAISKAIKILPTIKLKQAPRMADFARWGCAIAEALGYTKEQFLEAYTENLGIQNRQAIEESSVASCIVAFMKWKTHWNGTSSALLKDLKTTAENEEIDIKSKSFPKSPSALSRVIGEVGTNLLAEGIKIEKVGQREWKIKVIENCRQSRNADENASDEANNGDDIDNGNDIDVSKIPF